VVLFRTWCVVPVVAVQPGAKSSSAPAGTVLVPYGTCNSLLCHGTKYQLGTPELSAHGCTVP